MKSILHIITKPTEILPVQISDLQTEIGYEVSVVDISQAESDADYRALLEAIFQADNVSVW